MAARTYPTTPDGRYFVARGRLWRKTNPRLNDTERRAAIKALMQARRDERLAKNATEAGSALFRIKEAKRQLGEDGPVWWTDGAPDESGKAPENSSYADWWAGLSADEKADA